MDGTSFSARNVFNPYSTSLAVPLATRRAARISEKLGKKGEKAPTPLEDTTTIAEQVEAAVEEEVTSTAEAPQAAPEVAEAPVAEEKEEKKED